MSSAAASWHDVFAGAGARAEHEQRLARIRAWIRRCVRGYRSPALDREALIRLHRNREVARRLEREHLGDVLRLGGPALR
jgi:hypothetical protein